MSQARIQALEGLLARVQSRARGSAGAPARPAVLELDEAFADAKPSFEDAPAPAGPIAPTAEVAPPSVGAAPISAGPASVGSASVGSASAAPRSAPASATPASLEATSADFEEIEDLDDVEEISESEMDLEAVPESHSSPVATSMEQALATAADAPPLTPPPESGPEPAPVRAPHPGPTMVQLGETISLEEGPDRAFELDEPMADVEPHAPSSERHLEADLPGSSLRSVDDGLLAPPSARQDLERVRLGEAAHIEAEIVQRPTISTNVVDFVSAHQGFSPESFLALVDASLSL